MWSNSTPTAQQAGHWFFGSRRTCAHRRVCVEARSGSITNVVSDNLMLPLLSMQVDVTRINAYVCVYNYINSAVYAYYLKRHAEKQQLL